jgi:hypothetical protein
LKKFGFFLIVVLALSAIWLQNQSSLSDRFTHAEKKSNPSPAKFTSNQIKGSISNEKFNLQLSRASQQLSQIQEDPVQVEIELRQWAQAMNETELSHLEALSFDRQRDQDLRFLAVTLLSWSKNSAAGGLLTNIAGSSFDEILNPGRLGDFEKILRLRAAEGLGELSISSDDKKSYIQQILNKTPYAEVSDRALRLQWNLDGAAPSPEAQDQQALEKLLSREE